MLKTVYDTLKQINELPHDYQRIEALKQKPALSILFKIVYESDLQMLLPETDPPYKKMAFLDQENRFWSELRRLRIFFNTTTEYAHLKTYKREQLFIEILESISEKDAELLLLIKNKKNPFTNIGLKEVLGAYPGLIDKVYVAPIVSEKEALVADKPTIVKKPSTKPKTKKQPESTGLSKWQEYKLRKAAREAALTQKEKSS